MRRCHQWFAMHELRQCQIIVKKIDAMHMNHIRIAHMLQHIQCNGVAAGAAKRQAYYRHTVDHVFRRQGPHRISEQAIERHDRRCLLMLCQLVACNILHDILHATDGWMILPHQVDDLNWHSSCPDLRRYETGYWSWRIRLPCRAIRNTRSGTTGCPPSSAPSMRFR